MIEGYNAGPHNMHLYSVWLIIKQKSHIIIGFLFPKYAMTGSIALSGISLLRRDYLRVL